MSKYRHQLPQLSGELFLTDGGLETTLVFHNGIELPCFAAFDLLKNDAGRETLQQYFHTYISLAKNYGVGFILESVTWRANPDWAKKIGYSDEALADINRQAIELLEQIRNESETEKIKMVISGCIGPRDDGYNPANVMSEEEAQEYHSIQIETFRDTAADMVAAITMTYAQEVIGIARAANDAGMPVAISFTVETNGVLPSGQTLKNAIEQVDEATGGAPAYYMINCAHPTHFQDALATDEPWLKRIQGLRANASTKSHAELDEAEELDAGNPVQLGSQYSKLIDMLPHLNVIGGCCGTDHRHIEEICKACID